MLQIVERELGDAFGFALHADDALNARLQGPVIIFSISTGASRSKFPHHDVASQ